MLRCNVGIEENCQLEIQFIGNVYLLKGGCSFQKFIKLVVKLIGFGFRLKWFCGFLSIVLLNRG